MTYATLSDLEEAYTAAEILQLADRDGSGAVDAGVVAAALAKADAEIDAYLAGRYVLPLATVPPLLTEIACAITRYKLMIDTPLPEARIRYEDVRRLLEGLAAGRGSLGLPAATAPTPAGQRVRVSAPARIFNLSRY